MSDYLGIVAGLLVTCGIIPQLVRTLRLKSAREISLLYAILLWLGMMTWLVYGILLGLTQVVIWNAVGGVLILVLIVLKLWYERTV
ncbi:MAG: hypothetical protein JRD68_07045 [Deltaproteobacteria bacterium]|nr:hypothetical protein [Deltaproteobacteria bacterium]